MKYLLIKLLFLTCAKVVMGDREGENPSENNSTIAHVSKSSKDERTTFHSAVESTSSKPTTPSGDPSEFPVDLSSTESSSLTLTHRPLSVQKLRAGRRRKVHVVPRPNETAVETFQVDPVLEDNNGDVKLLNSRQAAMVDGKQKQPGEGTITTLPPHHYLDLDRYFFTEENNDSAIPEPQDLYFSYMPCWLHDNDQKQQYYNPKCPNGLICVEKETRKKIRCPGDEGFSPHPCPCTSEPGAGECPPGCLMNTTDCALKAPDGYCGEENKKFEDKDYEASTMAPEEIPRPMVYFQGAKKFGEFCEVYGDLIHETQKGPLKHSEKVKAMRARSNDPNNIGHSICKWVKPYNLECIPDDERKEETTVAGLEISEEDKREAKKLAGTCKCRMALGGPDRAVDVRVTRTNEKTEKEETEIHCYIPANRGPHSNCDHEILPPYGTIYAVLKTGREITYGWENASRFCVPNSDCRIGYKFTGKRCMCRRNATWNGKNFTCGGKEKQTSAVSVTPTLIGAIGLFYVFNI